MTEGGIINESRKPVKRKNKISYVQQSWYMIDWIKTAESVDEILDFNSRTYRWNTWFEKINLNKPK